MGNVCSQKDEKPKKGKRGAKGKPVKVDADPRLKLPGVESVSTTAATTPGLSVSTTAASTTPSAFGTPITVKPAGGSFVIQPSPSSFLQPNKPRKESFVEHVLPAPPEKSSFLKPAGPVSPSPQRITAADGTVYNFSRTADPSPVVNRTSGTDIIWGDEAFWGSSPLTRTPVMAPVQVKQSPSPFVAAQTPRPSPVQSPFFKAEPARSPQIRVVQVQSPQFQQVQSPQIRIVQSPMGQSPNNRFMMPGPPAMSPQARPVNVQQRVVQQRVVVYR